MVIELIVVAVVAAGAGFYVGGTMGANKWKNVRDAVVEDYEAAMDQLYGQIDSLQAKIAELTAKKTTKKTAT